LILDKNRSRERKMEVEELKIAYQIDKERLTSYFKRIENRFKDLEPIQVVGKFINNQGIGTSLEEVLEVLNHYNNFLTGGKSSLDFAFEWIRAHKIRVEYKKYLIRAQYPTSQLAIDDCIYLFFLKYDKYIRQLLNEQIPEYEISALYELFFSQFGKIIKIDSIIERLKVLVPTVNEGDHKVNLNILTLRAGLSQIIDKDYESVLSSREEEKKKKDVKAPNHFKKMNEDIPFDFGGGGIERKLRTYCFNKEELRIKEIESAISQFLNPYFKFGKFYNYNDFKDKLIDSLTEAISSGLTDKVKERCQELCIKESISNSLENFRAHHKIKVLDGLAWSVDLKKVLTSILKNFVDNLFSEEKGKDIYQPTLPLAKVEEDIEELPEVNFSAIFDINLEIEDYRAKLEALLKDSKMGRIEKTMLIRTKVQELQMVKRKGMYKQGSVQK